MTPPDPIPPRPRPARPEIRIEPLHDPIPDERPRVLDIAAVIWLLTLVALVVTAAMVGFDHADVRADKLLIAEDGTVSFVDWAYASRGSRTADALQLLASVDDPAGNLQLNARIDAVLDEHQLPGQIATDVLTGILGFFVDAARRPHDPRLPLLREHRLRRRDSLLRLVQERWT